MGNKANAKKTIKVERRMPTEAQPIKASKFILQDVTKEELEKRRIPVYPYLM
jgi:hypothetical protein